MSSYTEGQTHQLMNALEAAEFTPEDITKFGQFKDLSGVRNLVRGQAVIQVVKRLITRLPFDPVKNLGEGWSWWKGPGGQEDCDPRSLVLNEVDFTQVRHEICLKENEPTIKGEEKLRRLKASGHILLDPDLGWALYNEPGQKTLRWLYDTFGTTYLDFFGRVLRDPRGSRSVLCLNRDSGGLWDWYVCWLGRDWDVSHASAVLPAK